MLALCHGFMQRCVLHEVWGLRNTWLDVVLACFEAVTFWKASHLLASLQN